MFNYETLGKVHSISYIIYITKSWENLFKPKIYAQKCIAPY